MLRRSSLLIVLVAVLAACGSAGHHATTSTTPPRPRHKPKPQPKPHQHKAQGTIRVTVFDGDLNTRVRHAVIRAAGHTARTDRSGRASVIVPLRRQVAVTVSARHYGEQQLPVEVASPRPVTLRVYQPRLQWPLYGADHARTQSQTHIRLRPPFHVVWSRGIHSLIEFPASVYDGVAYLGSYRGVVRAISMRDGKLLWLHISHGYPKMASSPAAAGSEVVYHTMDGHVYVLNARNGHLLWSWHCGSPIESSPIVWHGLDYFGAGNGTIYALDLRTHKLRWSKGTGAKITSSAAISGNTLYIGDYAGRLWALNPHSGATRWVASVGSKIYGTPAVSHGRVFAPGVGNTLTAFTTRGSRLWSFRTGGYVYSSPAVWSGRVFFGSYDGNFYALSAASGHLLWRVDAGGPISGAATVVDGVAYAGSFAHRILGIDARTGRRVWTFPHGEFVPLSGNGSRLLVNGFSRVYAVEPRHERRQPHEHRRHHKRRRHHG